MTEIAKQMWDAYAEQADGNTFDGKPLPTWEALGEERQGCWIAASEVAANRIKTLEQIRDHAYRERNHLAAFLSHLYPAGIKATNIPGWAKEWHGCVYIDLPTGQVSWHYHEREAHLFSHLGKYKKEWDGHGSEEKYERLARAALGETK